jgi:hypothetical protein
MLTAAVYVCCCPAACCVQPAGDLVPSYGMASPGAAGWQVSDLLREVPDTPSMHLLAALPDPQRECLLEAARMFVSTAPTMG